METSENALLLFSGGEASALATIPGNENFIPGSWNGTSSHHGCYDFLHVYCMFLISHGIQGRGRDDSSSENSSSSDESSSSSSGTSIRSSARDTTEVALACNFNSYEGVDSVTYLCILGSRIHG